VAVLPAPMLARAESALPVGDYALEVKRDGFRAVVSTEDDFRVRSRRGWNMAPLIPELAREDVRGVFDGELIAFREGLPHFPLVTARMLHRRREIPVAFAVFDVLALDGEPTTNLPYARRRELLETLDLGGGFWFLPPVFDDEPALFAATCKQGLEKAAAPAGRNVVAPR
jgi:bifunctional non-homologous end joining protein LigD